MFDTGLDIRATEHPMGFTYGESVLGPVPETRRLAAIRASLLDPACAGPEDVYCIAMDVCRADDHAELIRRNLLFGVVTYAGGRLGCEPVRSQGHIHAVSPSCGRSTCEVYEIWDGVAIIYMQRSGGDDAQDCYAVRAEAGDVVIVPPDWVHATVNASDTRPMTFGAWCVRDYGFDYKDVRAHGGIAFFPVWEGDRIVWRKNPRYTGGTLLETNAFPCDAFGVRRGVPIYRQYRDRPDTFDFVPNPAPYDDLWREAVPPRP